MIDYRDLIPGIKSHSCKCKSSSMEMGAYDISLRIKRPKPTPPPPPPPIRWVGDTSRESRQVEFTINIVFKAG